MDESDELVPVASPFTKTPTPLEPGKLRIHILSSFLNVKVKRPYVVITLGDQRYQTSASDRPDGAWIETFELHVTFHTQLFGSIQFDLYDNFTLYPDKHIGRAEMRLGLLSQMPETFMNYFEVWDKTVSAGASSSIGRERAGVNNVGALQVKMSYRPSQLALPPRTTSPIKTIGQLLAIFGQGFELGHVRILTGLNVLDKFYGDLPRSRTWEILDDLSAMDRGARFWRFAIASYGWKGLNFIGKGNGIWSDAIRNQADEKCILGYLGLPKQDLLAYEFRAVEAFRPSYFIARDRFTNSIVLSIRGTMSITDTLTDLVCEYEPWRGGFIHSGMKSSAMWFYKHVVPQLVAFHHEHGTTGLILVGHSLGAATAAILTIMLTDHLDEFKKQKEDEFHLSCYGYAPACGLSLDLAEKYKDIIQSFVFADDIVSKLSYGSVADVKELILASSEACRDMGLSEIIWSSDLEGEKWKKAFKRISEVRKRCLDTLENPRLYVAGQIYQFWLEPTPSNDTRIVVEKTTAAKVCTEVIVKKSMFVDHLPTNFDIAFRRARETIMMEGKGNDLEPEGYSTDEESVIDGPHTIWSSLAELSLKHTTERTGGEGQITKDSSR